MQHDDFPREQGLWPKAGLPYRKRRVKTPKVLHIVLARQNTSVLPSVASREPDFRASCSICQHALERRVQEHPVTEGQLNDCDEQEAGWYMSCLHIGHLNQSQGGMCICRVLGIGAGVSRECFGP